MSLDVTVFTVSDIFLYLQAEEKEKLLKRKQRFGAVTAGATVAAGTPVSSDEVEVGVTCHLVAITLKL